MKKHLVFISALSLCFGFSKAQLTYTQITSGLNTVTFEGGETELEVGDVDGDGDLDIVSIGDHGSPNVNVSEGGIMVWKNNGTGTSWSLTKTGNLGYGGIALGDVNGDGKMDVGYGMHHNYSTSDFGDQYIEVATGDGTGSSWTPYDNGLADTSTGINWGMFGTDFADVNNDGWLDLASVSFGCCDGLWIYKNNHDGSWTSTDGGGVGNVLNSGYCMFGDFNNDGNVDIAISSQAGSIFKNNGLGQYSMMQTGFPSDWTMKFDIGDVNNDGGKDVACITPGSGGGGAVEIYTYNKTTSSWQKISTGLPTTGILGVGLDDMDMDGNCDLLAWTTTGINIYKGDGTGINWTANGTIPLATSSNGGFRGMSTGDFDHDGFTDIAFFGNNGGNNSLKVFLHTVSNPALNIVAENPKGGECFAPNSVQFVHWNASVPTSSSATVKIEFSSSSSSGPWTTVTASSPNSGTYQWITPAVNSPTCFLKFTITSGSNSQTFTTNAFGIGTCNTTTAVNESTESLEFGIYPNPSSGEFTIYGLQSSVELSVYDMLGEKIFSKTLNEKQETINLTEVKSGIYFCEIKKGNKSTTQKLVVVK